MSAFFISIDVISAILVNFLAQFAHLFYASNKFVNVLRYFYYGDQNGEIYLNFQ